MHQTHNVLAPARPWRTATSRPPDRGVETMRRVISIFFFFLPVSLRGLGLSCWSDTVFMSSDGLARLLPRNCLETSQQLKRCQALCFELFVSRSGGIETGLLGAARVSQFNAEVFFNSLQLKKRNGLRVAAQCGRRFPPVLFS